MEGRTSTSPAQHRVLAQGRSSGECPSLKSHIYLSVRIWHSTSTTNLVSRELNLAKLRA